MPRLVEALKRHQAEATFFFALGPDQGGLYGTALPAPDIGRRCAPAMRAVRDAGFEVGMLGWNSVKWRRGVSDADAEWTARQMGLAMARFEEIFGERATVHGAAGWRMNRHAYRNTQALGFDYASDTRGTHPFVPVVRAEIVACPQVPTTLPTLDEVQGSAPRLLEQTAGGASHHVFAARAEREGRKLAPAFEQVLEGWKAQGYELVRLRDLLREVAANGLPMHAVEEREIPGRRAPVAAQGTPFLT